MQTQCKHNANTMQTQCKHGTYWCLTLIVLSTEMFGDNDGGQKVATTPDILQRMSPLLDLTSACDSDIHSKDLPKSDILSKDLPADENDNHLLKSVSNHIQSHVSRKNMTALIERCEQRHCHLVDCIAADRRRSKLDELTMYGQLIADTLSQVRVMHHSESLSSAYGERYAAILQLILDMQITHLSDGAPLHNVPPIVLHEHLALGFVFCLVAVMWLFYWNLQTLE